MALKFVGRVTGGVKKAVGRSKAWVKKVFLVTSEGKKSLNLKASAWVAIPGALVTIFLASVLSNSDDTSGLSRETARMSSEPGQTDTTNSTTPEASLHGISTETPTVAQTRGASSRAAEAGTSNVHYRAKQVLVRQDVDAGGTLPIGTSFIGELKTTIDSRAEGKLVRIGLPFGGGFKNNIVIPNNTNLLGIVTYPGNGEKVFLQLRTGVYPDGGEFKLEAQVLDAEDFSPGLKGEYHGTFSNRVGSTLGLSFVAGMTDVLQDKEALGQGFYVTPKATMKNALLKGVSDVTKQESEHQAEELNAEKPYITIEAGRELIVSLTQKFSKME